MNAVVSGSQAKYYLKHIKYQALGWEVVKFL